MAKATNLLYGTVIAICFFSIMLHFITSSTQEYELAVPQNYNDTFQAMSDLSPVEDNIEELKDTTLTTEEPPKSLIGEAIDIIGKYFERAIKSITLIPKMLNVLEDIARKGTSSTGGILGVAKNPILSMILLSLTIFVVGFIISSLLKKDI